MARISVRVLSEKEIRTIHDGTMKILRDTGVMVHHAGALDLLARAGAKMDKGGKIARLPEQLVVESIEQASKKYILYGRDLERTARFGCGDLVLMSSPGQYSWIDTDTGLRRAATIRWVCSVSGWADSAKWTTGKWLSTWAMLLVRSTGWWIRVCIFREAGLRIKPVERSAAFRNRFAIKRSHLSQRGS